MKMYRIKDKDCFCLSEELKERTLGDVIAYFSLEDQANDISCLGDVIDALEEQSDGLELGYEVTESPTTTGEFLKATRTAAGLTQAKAARIANVPIRTLQSWEYGNRDCPEYTFKYVVAQIEAYEPDTAWDQIRGIFGDKCFKTFSDIGAVTIFKEGDEETKINIHNKMGDGITRVVIFGKDEDPGLTSLMGDSLMTVWGEWYISDCDCGEMEPVAKLDGRYSVYVYEGLVAFVEF